MTAALVVHPIAQPEADAIRTVLWSAEHIPVGVHISDDATGPKVNVWPVGRPLTTAEEVTALRAFCGATDLPVRWIKAVDPR